MSNWPIFGGARYEAFGADASASAGTNITPSASADTKGSYVQLIASTGFTYEGITLAYYGRDLDESYLWDLAIGAASSEQIIWPNIFVDHGRAGQNAFISLPLTIPGGSRISARSQSSGTSSNGVRVSGRGFAGGFASHVGQGVNRLVAFGEDTADSAGTSIDPGGTAHTKGSWVELSASVGQDLIGLVLAPGNQRNAAPSTSLWLLDIGIGGVGSEVVLVPDIAVNNVATIRNFCPTIAGWFPVSVPAGSRLAVRAQCNITNATDRLLDVVLYGLVA